jgi:hypothetical protein
MTGRHRLTSGTVAGQGQTTSTFDMSTRAALREAADWFTATGYVVEAFEGIPYRLTVHHGEDVARDVWRLVGIVDPAAEPR